MRQEMKFSSNKRPNEFLEIFVKIAQLIRWLNFIARGADAYFIHLKPFLFQSQNENIIIA